MSTRAAADSAARAGFDVTALDAYADLDQHPSVRALSVTRDFGLRYSASAIARISQSIDADVVVYLSSFENHCRAVAALSAGRVLWGNPPSVLRRVRDPLVLASELHRRGCRVPAVNGTGSHLRRTLLKPRASGGGHGIRPWRTGDAVPRGCYLQEAIDGVAGSIVFAAANGRAVPIAMSRQIVGDSAFGGSGYRYCGSIIDASDAVFGFDSPLFATASALANAAAEAFGLVGVNGIDFIAQDDVPWAVELNPRWSSSMELVERASGVSMFATHAAACTSGVSSLNDSRSHFRGAMGKAIVFARADVRAGDTRAWLEDPDLRDVPHPGERIPAGRPVCTVFANGSDARACHAALAGKAAAIHQQLDRWTREAA